MNRLFRNSLVVVVLIVAACAGSPPESVPLDERLAKRGYIIAEPVKRLQDYRINGWNSVDRYNVILIVGASLTYLITVRSPCDGLNSAGNLAFSTTIGDLTDNDKLLVRSTGGYIEHCYIDKIHLLEKIGQNQE